MIGLGRYRIGRRGAFLTLFGVAYLMIGQALVTSTTTPIVRHVFRFALSILPLPGWGVAWLVCGTVAIVDGLWPHGRDMIGFAAAVLAPVAWSIVYLAAWLQLDAPGAPVGRNLWESALLYAVIAAAVLIVAGMPEPRVLRKIVEEAGLQ